MSRFRQKTTSYGGSPASRIGIKNASLEEPHRSRIDGSSANPWGWTLEVPVAKVQVASPEGVLGKDAATGKVEPPQANVNGVHPESLERQSDLEECDHDRDTVPRPPRRGCSARAAVAVPGWRASRVATYSWK